jgi:4-aminobutyrate aminotransferase-like enzyme
LAKQATGKQNLVVFEGGFHGRTHLTMAMSTSKAVYRAGYGPLPSGIVAAPTPRRDDEVQRCVAALEEILATQSAASETAAFVIEPVSGEGGYHPVPHGFLRALRQIATRDGILFVADEVQTGFGRTGTMFAVAQAGVEPDIIVMGKGMGSGFPVSAIGAPAELMARWPSGSHGGTYGGNPLACAAAIATLDVMADPDFLANVCDRGSQLDGGLRELGSRELGIVDVRGVGLMRAVEFDSRARAERVLVHCLEQSRLILMSSGHRGTTIRWMPPLVVTAEEIERGLLAFAEAVRAAR